MAVTARPQFHGSPGGTRLSQQSWWAILTLAATELVLLVGVLDLYDLVVRHVGPDAAVATDHGRSLWTVETAWGLDLEQTWHGALVGHELALHAAHLYYAYSIYLAPSLVAILLLVRDLERYRSMRRTFVITTLLAYGAFWLYPLAPPCLLPESGITCQEPSPPDPFAAMPSLHVAWAGVAAVGVVLLGPRLRLRVAAVLHVVLTIAVVIATGHHFVLDTLAGLAVVLASVVMTHLLQPLEWLTPRFVGRNRGRRRRPRSGSWGSPLGGGSTDAVGDGGRGLTRARPGR